MQNATLWRALLGVEKTVVEDIEFDEDEQLLVAHVRRRAPLRARTCATRSCSSSSNSMSSTTVFSTPNRARHKVAFCTPFSALWLLDLNSSET